MAKETNSISTFHLAEGPGGFIEALSYLRFNTKDTYYGMTLIDNSNHSIPGWKKTENFIKKYPNVVLETGHTGNGDLFDENNFIYCKNKYGNSMHLVTADGGFDFSANYFINDTENLLVGRPKAPTEPQVFQPSINLGKMRNNGFEFALTNRNQIGDLQYDATLLFTSYNNEVVKIDDNEETFFSQSGDRIGEIARTQAGQPISSFWGYEILSPAANEKLVIRKTDIKVEI